MVIFLSALLAVLIVVAWRLIARSMAFKQTTTTYAGVIKRSLKPTKRNLKPMLIFIAIAAVLVSIGVAIFELAKTREFEAKQAETRLKTYELENLVGNLTVAQADKYEFCWESGMSRFFGKTRWPNEMETQFKMEKCLSAAVSSDFLVMQDWYKTSKRKQGRCLDTTTDNYSRPKSCNQIIRNAAKNNRWPIDYPERVVATIAPIERAEYRFLYEQSWATPLLNCLARSTFHIGKTTPGGRRIPPKWSQSGESCEFSYDLLEKAAREAGWPMGEDHFPVSYHIPGEGN